MAQLFSERLFEESGRLQWLIVTTIGLGLILRFWQFSAGASLWLDELAIVRNIIYLPLGRLLFSPLEYDQMAPVGFLAAGRLLSIAIADQDWVFRVVPLIFSMLTLPLIYLIGRKTIGALPAAVATALVSLSPTMVYLGAIAKQYSCDVFVCTALMYGGLRAMSGEADKPDELFRLGLIGGILLFFSFPAVPVAFGLTVCVVGRWVLERRIGFMGRIIAFGAPLAACAGLASVIALRVRSSDTASYMTEFWSRGFPPSLAGGPAWLWGQLSDVYEKAFFDGWGLWATVFLSLGLVGGLMLIRKRDPSSIIILVPLVVAVAAAIAHLYPLANRVALFLTPSLAILTASGVHVVGTLAGRLLKSAAPVVYAATIVGTVLALLNSPPPYFREEMRPLIQSVAAEWRPTDDLYSYYAANQAVDYYGERFGITEWQAGTCHRGNPRAYLEELDVFRGSPRVWVLFTHVQPRYAEADVILGYLRTIGTEVRELSHRDRVRTSAYLFDLSDPVLLDRVTARDYAFEAPVGVNPRLGCSNGPHAKWRRP